MRGIVGRENVPKAEEEDTEEDGQKAHTDRLGLLEDLDDTVQKCGNPKEPFKQGSKHDSADDGHVDNLVVVSYKACIREVGELTSLVAHGSVISGIPLLSALDTRARTTGPTASHIVKRY